ncbi:hypothetical protein ACFL2V_15140 [Pseudomonadota bacterium]
MKKATVTTLSRFVTFACVVLLGGCNGGGSGSSEPPISDSRTLTLSFQTEGSAKQATAVFNAPEGEFAITPNVTIPLYADIGENSVLGLNQPIAPPSELPRYRSLSPHPELLCEQPDDNELTSIASQLGGYKKGVQIYIEPDAATPTLLDGIESTYSEGRITNQVFISEPTAESSTASTDNAASTDSTANPVSVDIQRPNLTARNSSKAFYLSRTYGLIVTDITGSAEQPVRTSCALPLPGRAVNLLVTEEYLIVLLHSLDGKHSGILRLSLSDTNTSNSLHIMPPSYVDSLFFENHSLLDARMFNQTLAVYLKKYQAEQKDYIDAEGIAHSYTYLKLDNYQLKFIETDPALETTHTQVFNYADENMQDPNDDDRWSNYFNHFLSASGEYLVVSETRIHSYISHYETKSAYRCTEYEKQETPYSYCSINWKRIENPDYVTPTSSGVINCSGSLLSCIKAKLPAVSRYIFTADGESCHSGVNTRHICVAGHAEQYQVPVRARDNFSRFHVFRFNHKGDNTGFHKLDDTLASLDGQDIHVTDTPFQLPGRIQKHDHLHFKGNQFYAITQDGENSQLHSLSIIGNSAIVTDTQTFNARNRYSKLSTSFTENKIYVSEAGYSVSAKRHQSNVQVFSLNTPLSPVLESSFSLPTKLDQLLTNNNLLIGLGSSFINEILNRNYVGTITAFSSSGQELNSLLLGSDYRSYSSTVSYDDQAITFDQGLNRLFMPYQGASPLAGGANAPEVKRLSIINVTENDLEEEHTFTLPVTPQRTLSLSSSSALSFSDEYIHQLSKQDTWQAKSVFDGNIPDSIYYSRNYPTHVQKIVHTDRLEFKLVDGDEGASGQILDEVMLSRSSNNICLYEQVYFDQDRILIVQEKPGVYTSYQDCPQNRQNTETRLSGYHIGSSQLTTIDNQQELEQLLQLIRWDLYCIIDTENTSGKRIKVIPEDVNELSCYTPLQYSELRYSAPMQAVE